MPKDYTLRLYSSVLQADPPNFVMDLTHVAQGWRRSIRSDGGFWLGKFVLSGRDANDLQSAFETWLGYDVKELSGGMLSWQGLVYEMDFIANGVRRRRSLDMMSNAVRTTYTKEEYTGDNFVKNFSLEQGGGGGSDIFAAWSENTGTAGAIAVVGPGGAADGSYYVRLTADQDDDPEGMTYIQQHIQVTPGARYKLTYYTKGDATAYNGRIGVNDPNIGSGVADWVVYPHVTGVSANTWTQCSDEFVGPSEGDIQIFLFAPLRNPDTGAQGTADFDKIELYEWLPGVYQTDWKKSDGSVSPIGRYGQKEEIIHLDEYSEATSIYYRDTYWSKNAWPWMRPVSAQPPGPAVLEVSVAGYVFTANWLYIMAGDGQVHHISHWINEMAGSAFGLSWRHGGNVTGAGDCQFLKAGSIDDNTLEVTETTGLEERPFDRMLELAQLGDSSGNPWRVWVGEYRLLHYRRTDLTTHHYIREDGIFDTMAGTNPSNPWLMRPGVVKDMTYRSGFSEPGSFLSSNQDFFVEEIEMADGWSRPALKTALLGESELLQALMEVALAAPVEPPETPWPPPVNPEEPPLRPPHP